MSKRGLGTVREAETLFRTLADASPVMIFCSGADKGVIFVNRAWLSFTGRTMEQELGYGWTEGLHADDFDRALAEMASSLDARRDCDVEFRLRRADGEYRSLRCCGVPRFGSAGNFAGCIATCTETSDEKRMDEWAIVRQKLKSVSWLANGMRRDFDNRFARTLASTEAALTPYSEGLPVARELQMIRTATVGGVQLIRDLTIDEADERTTLQPVDLGSLTKELLPLLRASLSPRAVLKVNIGTDASVVQGNPADLWQVIVNLVMNASDAIGERDGVIEIKVRQPSAEMPPSSDRSPRGYLQLEVSDTGYGMTPEAQAQMFDPFFTTKFCERGLGLALVRKILRRNNAEMSLISTPGVGTTVQAWFRSAGKTSEASVRGFVGGDEFHGAKSILMVEDDDLLRTTVAKGLRKRGFRVREACSRQCALDLIRSDANRIDLIVLDVMLHGIPSREVFEETQRLRPDVRIIMTSAHTKEAAFSSFCGLPVGRFIRKPFHIANLTDSIREALSL